MAIQGFKNYLILDTGLYVVLLFLYLSNNFQKSIIVCIIIKKNRILQKLKKKDCIKKIKTTLYTITASTLL